MDDGRLVGSDVGRAKGGLIDAVFELMRLEVGTFSFDQERHAPAPTTPVEVGLIVAEAEARLAEWREIEAVVPSLSVRVLMVAELPGTDVVVRAEQWKLLHAFQGGRPAQVLLDEWDWSEFDTGRAVRDLVEAGLATIETDASALQAAIVEASSEIEELDSLDSESDVAESAEDPFVREISDENLDEDEPSNGRFIEFGLGDRYSNEASDNGSAGSDLDEIRALVVEADEAADEAEEFEGGEAEEISSEDLVSALAPFAKFDGPAEVDGEEVPELEAALALKIASGELESIEAYDGDEPINRGLLLKFLSSVRT